MKKLIILILILHCTLYIENCKSQWVQMSNGMGTTQNILSLANNGNNILAGTYYNQGVYLSTNNGTSWIQTGLNNSSVSSLVVIENNIFAGTQGQGIYLSTNGGMNWVQTSFNNLGIPALVANGTNIFAGTYGNGLYISTNLGVNWNQTSLTHPVLSLIVNGNNIIAGTEFNGIYTSTNNGVNWVQTFWYSYTITSLAKSGNNIYGGTDYNGVLISTDNGLTWSYSGLNNLAILSIATAGNNIIAGTGNNGTYLSTNNGVNWIQKNQGFSNYPTIGALMIINNYIFAGTGGQSVWRRNFSEIIRINNIGKEIPDEYHLYQNYPNPFNPSTNIKYQIANNKLVILKIYDILGKEVETLVNENQKPGTYEVTFDGSKLSSGIYFYTLTAGEYNETKKMVLIK